MVPLFVGLVERGLRWCGEEDIVIANGDWRWGPQVFLKFRARLMVRIRRRDMINLSYPIHIFYLMCQFDMIY